MFGRSRICTSILSQCRRNLTRNILEEITLGVFVVYSPPIIHEDVEQREDNDEETSRPLGLEPDYHHDASRKADKREDDTSEIPFPLEGYSNKQEDQENSAYQLETAKEKTKWFDECYGQ